MTRADIIESIYASVWALPLPAEARALLAALQCKRAFAASTWGRA